MDKALTDTYRHKGLRQQLVNSLQQKGIYNQQVLHVINTVPRHYFLDSAFTEQAYEDKAFPIGEGQTISQPYTVAYQSQLLNLQPKLKVLEIGTGSGYQACILAALQVQVYTIERQKKLYDEKQKFAYLKTFKNIKCFYGDGYEGLPTYAPFDRIIITAAAPLLPPKLVQQLKPNGILVMPHGSGSSQIMQRITKQLDNSLITESFENFSFVPMLVGKNN